MHCAAAPESLQSQHVPKITNLVLVPGHNLLLQNLVKLTQVIALRHYHYHHSIFKRFKCWAAGKLPLNLLSI